MKKNSLYIVTLFVSILLIWFGHKAATQSLVVFDGQNDTPVLQAVVTSITDHRKEEIALSEDESYTNEVILFNAEVLYGDEKGKLVPAYQNLNTFVMMQLREVAVGDKVILYQYPDETLQIDWSLGEYQRTDALLGLAGIFAILLIVFGKHQGLNTLVSLTFTIMAVFLVFIPAILSSQNIYLWTLIICCFVILSTFLIVNGYHKKSMVAAIGCFSGILVSAGMTLILNHILKLTGFVNEDSAYLMFINPDQPIDLRAIVFASIIIGALGAIMDVSMSIASSLYELRTTSPDISRKALISAGFNIGRDIMGTMSNTLILAYIGSSLSFVLLMVSYNPSIIDILNREVIVTEILQALIGSFALLFTMPLTTFVSALVFSDQKVAPPHQEDTTLNL